ncbi:MAG: hypothetical protein P8L31_08495 [Pseudomonadales bacterium]|nr:hypothetical protein [Pseudomonadales bacterium]
MKESSAEGPVVEATTADIRRQLDALEYHQKGHDFYKTRYNRAKGQLTRLRFLALVLAVAVFSLVYEVDSLHDEISILRANVSGLERALFD